MFAKPTKADLDRNLSTILHDAHQKARAERGRLTSEFAARGLVSSGALISSVARVLDDIHKEALERASPMLIDFADRMQITLAQIVVIARPHLQNMGNSVLGELPPAGIPAAHQQIFRQYQAIFEQRLEGALRDFEIGFRGGRNQVPVSVTPPTRPSGPDQSRMTDSELRGKLLSHFYSLRHSNGGYVPVTGIILSPEPVSDDAIAGVCRQLADAGLIEWTAYFQGATIGSARITGSGVDAVEKSGSASLKIQFPPEFPYASSSHPMADTAPNADLSHLMGPELNSERQAGALQVRPDENSDHMVLLIHGFNTFANWIDDVREELRDRGFVAEPTGFGYFGFLRFLSFPACRSRAIERVSSDIDLAILKFEREHAGAIPNKISVIAHSFGSWVIMRVLEKNNNLKLHRIVFCGSVLREDYDFRSLYEKGQFKHVLNQIGTRDYWPVIGESAGWGYGSIGSHGLTSPIADNRWYADFRHSDFLTREFCSVSWIPFLEGGKLTVLEARKLTDAERLRKLPWWIKVITFIPIRWILLFGLMALFIFLSIFLVEMAVATIPLRQFTITLTVEAQAIIHKLFKQDVKQDDKNVVLTPEFKPRKTIETPLGDCDCIDV
jgi:pimeloyl-ACP methyl ester carboxylesterase